MSSDNTDSILRDYSEHLDLVIKEPDEGIYDAINKGIMVARGDIIGILHSDDILHTGAITSVVEALSDPQSHYTCGPVDIIDAHSKLIGHRFPLPSHKLTLPTINCMPFPHLSMFIKKEIYLTLGPYSTEYLLSSDLEYSLRLISHGFLPSYLTHSVGAFRIGGSSGGFKTFSESAKIYHSYGRSLPVVLLNLLASLVKVSLSNTLPRRILLLLKSLYKSETNTYVM